MSERDPANPQAGAADESVLSRWSRLKADARRRDVPPAAVPEDAAGAPQADTDAPAAAPADVAAPATPPEAPPVPLPDLETLGEDSDYSAFLSPGVDAELRKLALRKLFRSPKFNVFDGLDTYRDDYRSFPALGSVVTADMQFQMERAARELAERAKAALTGDAPAPAVAAAAAVPAPRAPAAIPDDTTTGTPEDETRGRNEDDAAHGPA